MTQGHEYEDKVLDVLKRAVAEALERKRKLGQYTVVWREGRVVCIRRNCQPGLAGTRAGRKTFEITPVSRAGSRTIALSFCSATTCTRGTERPHIGERITLERKQDSNAAY